MAITNEHELESLLRGEIAAAETYKQVLDKLEIRNAAPLREMQHNHGEAIKYLYQELKSRGVEAPTDSGIWGYFAKTIEGAATLVGDKAALVALREGEKQGLDEYEMALTSGQLGKECHDYVAHKLIPAQRRHIGVLNRLIESH